MCAFIDCLRLFNFNTQVRSKGNPNLNTANYIFLSSGTSHFWKTILHGSDMRTKDLVKG
jgi:hypothetical protein